MALQEIDWGLPLTADEEPTATTSSTLPLSKVEALHHWLREPALQDFSSWLGQPPAEETLPVAEEAIHYDGDFTAFIPPLPQTLAASSIKPLQQLLEATRAKAVANTAQASQAQHAQHAQLTSHPLEALLQAAPKPQGNEALSDPQWQSVRKALLSLHQAELVEKGENVNQPFAQPFSQPSGQPIAKTLAEARVKPQEPYLAPSQAILEKTAQQEPYLDRFTHLIAMRLSDLLNDTAFRQDALQAETLRQDNVVLARYVTWLLSQHQHQHEQLKVLKQELESFKPAWGGFYSRSKKPVDA